MNAYDKWTVVVVLAMIWLIALVPLWTFLGVRLLVAPDGFWQNLAMGVLGVWVLGALQFLLAIIAGALTFGVLVDPLGNR